MSKLRAAISYKHRVDEVKTIQQQKMRENIAEPIIPITDDSNDDIINTNLESQERDPTNLENQESPTVQDADSDDENGNNQLQAATNWNNLINIWE